MKLYFLAIPENTTLSSWIQTAQAHCVKVNNEYCLSTETLQEYIKAWGGDIFPEVKIKEFMTSKKSYEVEASLVGLARRRSGSECDCCAKDLEFDS